MSTQPVLPEIVASSYKKYKEDTNTFVTWLSKVAKGCGYSPVEIHPSETFSAELPLIDTQGAPNPNKARKKKQKDAKQLSGNATSHEGPLDATHSSPQASSKYQVTTSELLRQVATVTSWTKGTITFPNEVQKVLQRSIKARKRCAAWFEKTGIRNTASRDGHLHFIDVLQQAFDNLKAHVKESTEQGLSAIQGSNGNVQNGSGNNIVNATRNRFTSLELEELDDDDNSTLIDQSETIPNQTKEVVQLEIDPEWEVTFAIYCFFEDLHRYKEEVARIWRKYKADETDLVSATILTTAIMYLVAKAEKELHAEYVEVFGKRGQSYTDLALTIFYAESLKMGEDPDERLNSPKSLIVTPFDDFIFLPTARVLTKFSQFRDVIASCAYPCPIPPMRMEYIIAPELLDTPEMLRHEKEDEILSQVLLDFALQGDVETAFNESRRRGPMRNSYRPAEDALRSALRPVWQLGYVTIESVFASEVLLDILEICGPEPNFRRNLLDTAEWSRDVFHFLINDTGLLEIDKEGIQWPREDQKLVTHTIQLMTTCIYDDRLPISKAKSLARTAHLKPIDVESLDPQSRARIDEKLRARGRDMRPPSPEHVENAERLNIQVIKPSKDLSFAINCNPLYSGTTMLNLAILQEQAGLALANHHLSIHATAHLYNALIQQNMIDLEWPALDQFISVHRGALFANDIPTTAKAMKHRIHLHTSQANKPDNNASQNYPWKLQQTPISLPLSRLLNPLTTTSDHTDTLAHLEATIKSRDLQATSENTPTKRYKKHRKQLRPTTPLQLTKTLSLHLPTLISEMTIDYIGLTRTCNALLHAVRTQLCQKQMHGRGAVLCDGGGGGGDGAQGWIELAAVVLEENSNASLQHAKVAGDKRQEEEEVFRGGESLKIVGVVMERFWRRERGLEGGMRVVV